MADLTQKVVNRRQFLGGTLAAGSLAMLAGCGQKGDPAGAGGGEGGTFRFYINNPVCIEPYNLQESEGTQVGYQLFDSLTRYNFETSKVEPLACTSYEPNDDATEFTFHLVEGAKFHDGTPVTSQSFKYGWERMCNSETNPETPSEISYHLSMVEGYNDEGNTTELTGVTCPDDLTLVVKLKYPFADFPIVCSHPALAPIPECAKDDFMTFFLAPVGNGPFMIDGKWEDGQYITLKRFDDYYGEPAKLEGVNFVIQKDLETGYREFEAGNLDYAEVPVAQIDAAKEKFGVSEDGYNPSEGKRVLLGQEPSTYYLVCNTQAAPFNDPEVRKAISLAINRDAICETIFKGTRKSADSIIPPGIDGYEPGVWEYCAYDPERAEQILDAAGYTKDANGSRGINFMLSYNNDGGHAEIMTSVIGDLEKIGITATSDTPEWAALLEKYSAGDFDCGRLGWVADYPIMDNFIYPLFYTGNGDNRSGYSNPEVDNLMMEARKINNDYDRRKAWQEINRLIGMDMPVIPLNFYCHSGVVSEQVKSFYLDPMKKVNLAEAELA